jgi:hypothetical protein
MITRALITGVAVLFLATGTAHAIEKTDEVYCYFGRVLEITRRSQDRAGLSLCFYDRKECERIVNRPWKEVKPNPPFHCAPGKLTYETPY